MSTPTRTHRKRPRNPQQSHIYSLVPHFLVFRHLFTLACSLVLQNDILSPFIASTHTHKTHVISVNVKWQIIIMFHRRSKKKNFAKAFKKGNKQIWPPTQTLYVTVETYLKINAQFSLSHFEILKREKNEHFKKI